MSAKTIDGKAISQKIKTEVKKKAENFEKQHGRPIGLAVILVGENPASQIYVRNKIKACEECGIASFAYYLEDTVSEEQLTQLIVKLNGDRKVDGILLQLPLPDHIRQNHVLSFISPHKDADGFLAENAGNLMLGNPSLNACTPCGIIELIKSTGIEISGKHAVVVGRSNIVGKPISLMLLEHDATVTMCHSHTAQLRRYTLKADILVVAVGKKHLITADMVKYGAVVIDVGMNREGGKLYGDVDYENVKDVAGHITPVPGGVGPMTIAMLLENVIKAAENFG